MESLTRIVQNLPTEIANTPSENEYPVVAIPSGSYPVKFNANGQAYLSKYTDEPATENQIKALLLGFAEIFNYSEQAIEYFVTAILDEKMSLLRLKDSVKHILKTYGKNEFGKPKPADIINFDKAKTDELLFLGEQMAKMAKGMVYLYYEDDHYRIMHYTELYDRSRFAFFIQLKDQFGLPIYEKKPSAPNGFCQCYFVFSEKGWQFKDELLWCLEQKNVESIQCKKTTQKKEE